MAISQSWTLYYNWGCGGTYYSTPIEFDPAGTFKLPDWGYSGVWIENGGTILFSFTEPVPLNSTYGGNVNGGAMVGAQIYPSNPPVQGCFYAIDKSVGAPMGADKLKAGDLTPLGTPKK